MAMMTMVGGVAVHAATGNLLGHYAINQGPADRTLLEYAKQSKEAGVTVSVLFRSDVLSQFTTNPLHGHHRADEALNILLRDTGLTGSLSAEGVVIITKMNEEESVMKRKSRLGWLGGLFGLASAQVFSPVTGTAYGQGTEPSAQSAAEELLLEEVIITGSRIQRPGFTSPTPVTTLDASTIENSGQVNIANVLNDIPAFRATTTETSSAQRNTGLGANYAELRGMGSMRTLVLMNGQRFVPQIGLFSGVTSNQVDLNVFPAIAVQRVDVVTGGASSAWGSDAVAGVVNLQMYRRYDGAKFDVQYGISSRGDNEGYAAQFLGGTSFFDDRAHIVLAGAWSQNDGVGDITHRNWWGDHPFILPDRTRCSTCYLAGEGWQFPTSAPGGVISGAALVGGGTSTALNNIAFGVGGTPYNMPQGYFRSGSDGIFGGTVPDNYDQLYVPFKAPSRRSNFYGNFDFDVTDNLTAYVTLNYSDRHVRNFTNAMIIPYTILSGNPFIPTSIQQQMTARNIASITVGVKHLEILTPPEGVNAYHHYGRTKRASAGFDWQLSDDWKIDGYLAYGVNNHQNFAPNQRNFARAYQAADAVVGPNGVITCRNPANGCVPINIFGVGSPSPAALAFITDDQKVLINTHQRVVALNLSGEAFSTWAGPVSVAIGAEYRKEHKADIYDPLTQAGAMNVNLTPTLNFSGELDVKEGYVETAVPLVSDVPGIRLFELNAAYRATEYSQVGRVNTWKVGALWKIADPLLFRATVSRDIRAPTITELFFPQTRGTSVTIPNQAQTADFFTGGNPNLKSEIADGKLFGITYRPSERFGVTLDYYNLDLSDVITSASGANVVNACVLGDANACAQWVRDSTGRVTRVNGGFSNISQLELRGVDAEIFLTLGLGNIPGQINLRAQGTYTSKLNFQISADQPVEDYAGQNSPGIIFRSPFWLPRFRGSFNIGYELEGFEGALVANYITKGPNEHLITTREFAQNDVPSYVKFDLNIAYRFGNDEQLEVYGNVRNLLDKAPPFSPNGSFVLPVSELYDTIGRTYLVGLRYSF